MKNAKTGLFSTMVFIRAFLSSGPGVRLWLRP